MTKRLVMKPGMTVDGERVMVLCNEDGSPYQPPAQEERCPACGELLAAPDDADACCLMAQVAGLRAGT